MFLRQSSDSQSGFHESSFPYDSDDAAEQHESFHAMKKSADAQKLPLP
jgi:hypothetical protein